MALKCYMYKELRLARKTISEHLDKLQMILKESKVDECWRLRSIKVYFAYMHMRVDEDMEAREDMIEELEEENERLEEELEQANSALETHRILDDIRLNKIQVLESSLRDERQKNLELEIEKEKAAEKTHDRLCRVKDARKALNSLYTSLDVVDDAFEVVEGLK